MPDAPVDLFAETDHEQVVFAHDPESGLRAVIAIHSTALGPGLGGTRFHPYESTDDAVRDVLALSRGMTYKNALAGLDLGGGKGVIIGDPHADKSEALLRAYGRFVESLGGRYYTACDVGTYSVDMDVVARETSYVTGRTVEHGGAGDSSVLTAYGVHQGMRASAAHLWGGPSLEGRTVGIAGVGKVGGHLVGHLVDEGAKVVITDVWEPALERVADLYPEVSVAASTESMLAGDAGALDIYAPCALGGAITLGVAQHLEARIVCGAANNQLTTPEAGVVLAQRGVLYAPDFAVNSGGVIQVADELEGFNFERARQRAHGIHHTTLEILERAASDGTTTTEAAERVAEQRIHAVGRLRSIHLP
ncbi:Glu/Leu/Phe/Val family dehydrogenase [Nocardioides jishulii]|uniref:Glu/Leu/Phe/Val dehydrogenase n=1 Tax=Nocardioides jishulii TaxID=2575440 RepID=A0A4U2YQV2_9ACTN|nr:Glu/Leu/Phe/Val dehydrogenase dimerization domain-containing protein [Nocardioides jishulii]QCX26408.1 Glu/Leu/Phe/Val dehydrogenase [Nocardioides jishulii]TKI63787.1 Glu/Leu/Phe/Val dehydrogenase [Nocardioides jishulii]